jgi:hypothetical protein
MKHVMQLCLVAALPASLIALPSPGSGTDDARPEPEATIRIDAAKAPGKVSRYLTGAGIEDVNHEIYGGLYSQMLFGESFQEPDLHRPLKGFVAHDGGWTLNGEELRADGGAGPKLVSDRAPFARGIVGVEIFFADREAGNAGLIVKTNKPGPGADNFDGYEVSLNPAAKVLTLGRHRHNWEPIKDVPLEVPTGEWVRLAVRMTEQSLDIEVNGKSVFIYEDREHPLKAGGFGLRQWQHHLSGASPTYTFPARSFTILTFE